MSNYDPDSIFERYSPEQLREIFCLPTYQWPLGFVDFVSAKISDRFYKDWLANVSTDDFRIKQGRKLYREWLDNVSDDEFRSEVRSLVEYYTYGYHDADGNQLLEFFPLLES